MNRALAKLVFFTTCTVFVFFGIYSAGMGSVLFELSDRTGSTLSAVGVIFTAIYTGSLLTQFASGWLTTRFGRVRVMTVSVFLMSLGLFGIVTSTSLALLIAACFVLGLGQGGVDIISNSLVTEAYPEKSVQVLNILHIVFGVGATISPILINIAIRDSEGGLLIRAGRIIALSLWFCLSVYPKEELRQECQKYLKLSASGDEQKRNPILSGYFLLAFGLNIAANCWQPIQCRQLGSGFHDEKT